MVQSILKETLLQKQYLQGETVSTIYFGGGTPSLLSIADCQQIIQTFSKVFVVAPDAEITLEANPDDITPEKLQGWKTAGINRLSIGIQSFFKDDLLWMNRAHNADQAKKCIEDVLQHGYSNFSIDLIYGTPLLTDEMWQQNVETAFSYGIPHLSCYALTVEEKTPLHKLITTQKKQNVDADAQARQFLLLMKWAREKGYDHYEVSNFAKPGFKSRHNSAYWRGEKYLGLGPSAHSFNGSNTRQWNVANNNLYIKKINEGTVPFEKEELSVKQQFNEYAMISLRTKEGMDLSKVRALWGERKVSQLQKDVLEYKNRGLVIQNNGHLTLTDEGMLMADGIAANLFDI